jgi:hypothetical protein
MALFLNFPGNITDEPGDGGEEKFAFVHCAVRGLRDDGLNVKGIPAQACYKSLKKAK